MVILSYCCEDPSFLPISLQVPIFFGLEGPTLQCLGATPSHVLGITLCTAQGSTGGGRD